MLGQQVEIFVDGPRIYVPTEVGSGKWIRFESTEPLRAEEAAGVVGNDSA